jgi:protein arginine N-methyltransferase 1
MEITGAAALFGYHRGMLQDHARVDAYREAVHAVVRPGDVVLDVGTGTGLLAFFACQAGARHVYAIEQGPIVALARELARTNGFADRVTFIHDLSFRATLPERASVLVTETLWSLGIGEGMIGFLADARERLLVPEPRVVPASVDLFLVPIEHPALHHAVAEQPEDRHGLDFSPMRSYAVNQVLTPRIEPRAFVAEPAHLTRVVLDEHASPDFGAEADYIATRAAPVQALAGWFEAELTEGIRVGNAPPAPHSHWAQVAFPLERPIDVQPGDRLSVRIDTVANGTAWRWSVTAGGAKLDQASLFGMPFDAPAHRHRAATAKPHRSREAQAVLLVLSRLDGMTTVEQGAEELRQRHAELFPQPDAAAQFARDVAERYGA